MSWPTPQEYNEAIQNPRFCFADAELRAANPETNSMGLPKARSGGFAWTGRGYGRCAASSAN
jgi:hypothetical protein